MQPHVCLLKEFGTGRYVSYLPEAYMGRHQLASNSLCSRDVRHLFALGHFPSDLGYEIGNWNEVTLMKLSSADVTIQMRTI
ncbi:hypothetical protein ALC62_11638 [Cyphomyrmex costatus]|uniref:Uncharacterized protein n=1 Tax=Cyphomyrmex costatus TaxID=456900 RepID=A0A151IC78_9HYME|nr:hypothetical protein ALC62_11638 [Cyphomyrmex costatus]